METKFRSASRFPGARTTYACGNGYDRGWSSCQTLSTVFGPVDKGISVHILGSGHRVSLVGGFGMIHGSCLSSFRGFSFVVFRSGRCEGRRRTVGDGTRWNARKALKGRERLYAFHAPLNILCLSVLPLFLLEWSRQPLLGREAKIRKNSADVLCNFENNLSAGRLVLAKEVVLLCLVCMRSMLMLSRSAAAQLYGGV